MQLIKNLLYLAVLIGGSWIGSSFLLDSTNRFIKNKLVIPDFTISKDSLVLIPEKGQWYYKNQPFSGKAILYHENGTKSEDVGYHNGRKEGKAEFWYLDGSIKKRAVYKENRLNGVLKVWSPQPHRTLVKESNYVNGVTHGIQKLWYTNGQIFKRMTIVNGIEEGLQQAWRKNGILYINYEAKNGRAFGLKRASLCYQLKKEDVQYE